MLNYKLDQVQYIIIVHIIVCSTNKNQSCKMHLKGNA